MNSAVLTGRVRHRRHRPREHTFSYTTHHLLLDVDELDRLDREVAGFGHNRRAPVAFRDTDHLGPADRPVRAKLADLLAANGVELPGGRVTLWTNVRVLGTVFNPVAWWFCHDRDEALALVVAEVRNTFGDTYCHVLDDLAVGSSGRVTSRAAKRLHVSPFLPVDGLVYDFTFRPPPLDLPHGTRVAVHMDVTDTEPSHETNDGSGTPAFDATVVETATPLTTTSLWLAVLRHPLVSVQTVAFIHLQALRLWFKRIRFHRRPEPPPNDLPGTTGGHPTAPPTTRPAARSAA